MEGLKMKLLLDLSGLQCKVQGINLALRLLPLPCHFLKLAVEGSILQGAHGQGIFYIHFKVLLMLLYFLINRFGGLHYLVMRILIYGKWELFPGNNDF
jgi:hypothetical protein